MEMEQTVCQQSSSSLFGLSLSAIAAVSCCLLLLLISSRNNNKEKKPPPGRGSSLLWSVLETMSFLADNSSGRGFYHFVEARHRRYGPPCFRTSLFGRTHVFVSSPDAARALLAAADSAAFSKRYVRTVADLLGEHSLLCASHERHRYLRRALAPLFFNAQTTASLAASFDALTVQDISGWSSSSSSVVVVLDAALGITFEAICGMLVGTLLRHDNKERFRQMQSDVLAVTQAMLAFPLRMRGTRFQAGLQARKRIMDVLRQEIASRRLDDNNNDCSNDFLQSLLLLRSQQEQQSSADNDNNLLSDEQILDNILTLIIAGQVTTATAITWMVKYLADNRGLQESLRCVQLELASNKEHDSALTLKQPNGMEYAYKVVKESLRMATIVSWFPRVALQDCQVAGRICPFTDKKTNRASKVSFSNHKTKKQQFVNLQYKKLWWEPGRRFVKLRLSTKALKTIEKHGLDAVARKAGIDLNKK